MVSRRSTRIFAEGDDIMEPGNSSQIYQEDEKERSNAQKEVPNASERRRTPTSDIGKTLGGSALPANEDSQEGLDSVQLPKYSSKVKAEYVPLNFGTVIPGKVYRSSFPMEEDFLYLKSLGLKTIVSLVKKDGSNALDIFIKENDIRHCVIDMQGTKKVAIPESTMQAIMEVVLNEENHPLLIHCNHGKHRTGCAVAVIRLVMGWDLGEILQEYTGFAAPKAREVDIKYITEYEISSLQALVPIARRIECAPVHVDFKWLRMIIFAALVLSIWIATCMWM